MPNPIDGRPNSSLLPSEQSELDVRLELALIVSIILFLSLLTVTANSIILAAFYRYKRLRTASNYLLVSLAVSDCLVGVAMPFSVNLQLSNDKQTDPSSICILPYCVAITLCSVSLFVSVAIAVDRLTSLAQPLRYKNIITHSSIERYIAAFWIYAAVVGFSPLLYSQIRGSNRPYSGSCPFNVAILPGVRILLFGVVWAPSALVLLYCYIYVYLIARAHARAIYTVELSFRNETQTLSLPRYGQTLAFTVGTFFILWIPFLGSMMMDTFFSTNILSDWGFWLGLPILAHSGINPWIYAFHHGEIRVATKRVAERLLVLLRLGPSYYGCSPKRHGSNLNYEMAEINNSCEDHRPPVEDCFAAKHHNFLFPNKKCLDIPAKRLDISPERKERKFCGSCNQNDIVEEDISNLKEMLSAKYIAKRVTDSNHNIDHYKSSEYLLDPTFNKIRYLRKLNEVVRNDKSANSQFQEYHLQYAENLKLNSFGTENPNTMSDPVINIVSPGSSKNSFSEKNARKLQLIIEAKCSNVTSFSDPNIKIASSTTIDPNSCRVNRFNSFHNITASTANYKSLYRKNYDKSSYKKYVKNYRKYHNMSLSKIFNSKLAKFSRRGNHFHKSKSDTLLPKSSYVSLEKARKHRLADVTSISIEARSSSPENVKTKFVVEKNTSKSTKKCRTLSNSNLFDTLAIPSIHSEPTSPMSQLPLAVLLEECESNVKIETSSCQISQSPDDSNSRHSDPSISFKLHETIGFSVNKDLEIMCQYLRDSLSHSCSVNSTKSQEILSNSIPEVQNVSVNNLQNFNKYGLRNISKTDSHIHSNPLFPLYDECFCELSPDCTTQETCKSKLFTEMDSISSLKISSAKESVNNIESKYSSQTTEATSSKG